MDLRAGALGGATGTLAMSGLNKALSEFGLVYETVPMQIVDRMAEVGLIEDWSPVAKRTVSSAAHLGYGTTAGVVLGALRREQGEPTTELAVGIALRLLAWGAGWGLWLPLLGVHHAPWTQRTPKVCLPVLGHAVFGAAWGLTHWALSRKQR